MKPAEFQTMKNVEDSHWWYVAQRDAMEAVLRTSGLVDDCRNGFVMDAGCGTGGHLQWLHRLLNPQLLAGFDLNADAVRFAQLKVPEATVWRDDISELNRIPEPVASSLFDLVLCSDVIYSIEQSRVVTALKELCSRLKSGGTLLLHVPAMMWLYSRHDIAVGTRHRYRCHEITTLLQQAGMELRFVSYRLCLLFPLIVLQRLPSILSLRWKPSATHRANLHGDGTSGDDRRSQLQMPWPAMNELLRKLMKTETAWLRRGLRFPFGRSILAIGRKP